MVSRLGKLGKIDPIHIENRKEKREKLKKKLREKVTFDSTLQNERKNYFNS